MERAYNCEPYNNLEAGKGQKSVRGGGNVTPQEGYFSEDVASEPTLFSSKVGQTGGSSSDVRAHDS